MSEEDERDEERPEEDPIDEDATESERPSHVEGSSGVGRSLTWVVLGVVALGGVIVLAMHRARPPARCPEGLVAMGPRCCGAGQRLEADRCMGAPAACATGMVKTPIGCVAEHHPVALEGGKLTLMPHDWEAAQKGVAPYEAQVAPFVIDSHEVTERQWDQCAAAHVCATVELSGEPGRPVVNVSLGEAQTYCEWVGGSLPTKGQWAFAAAGTDGRRYPWGETGAVCRRAAFGLAEGPCGEGATRPDLTGAHPDGATPEGIHDLAGNVAEWTAPIVEGDHQGKSAVQGGHWRDQTATDLRTWNEDLVAASTRADTIGFRCAYADDEAARPGGE